MADNILFDLDGTLTEPKKGIARCIGYALDKMGRATPGKIDFAQYIGPPLQESFGELFVTNEAHVIEKAISFFRERFREKGQYENEVYDGIEELLTGLVEEEKRLFVASSKPEVFVKNILAHFNLAAYFSGVYGSELNGTRSNKGELIEYLLVREDLNPAETVMIGDRKHDIIGAISNNLDSIGVLWGYGSREELRLAKATHICGEIPCLPDLLI